MSLVAKSRRQPRPGRIAYSMRALGKHDLPARLELDGRTYLHERTHKHDFWAATGFYVAEDDPTGADRVVLKMGRTEEFAGLPLHFIGRWLRWREMRYYSMLSDVPNVPPVLARVGETGFVHRYIPGRPLDRHRPVPDGFFAELQSLMAKLHERGIAYADANKPQNILLGDDGRPYLIDFQISYDSYELLNTWLNRRVVRYFQRVDLYHVLKHKRRMRPDELTPEERELAYNRGWLIRLHRAVTKPYFLFRRRTFKRLRETGQLLPEGSK